MSNYNILCLLIDHTQTAIGDGFDVSLGKEDLIAELRRKVKDEQSDDLQGVSANRLKVYKLCKPRQSKELTTEFLRKIRLVEESPGELDVEEVAVRLWPELEVGSDWPKGGIHVLIQRPPSLNVPAPAHLRAAAPPLKRPDVRSESKRPEPLQSTDDDSEDEGLKPPRKRRRTGFINDEQLLRGLGHLHRDYWGIPLGTAFTSLPTHPPAQEDQVLEYEAYQSSDVLPGDPILDILQLRFLVRAEYIRVFDMVESLYMENRNGEDCLVVVSGQPGIGKTTWIHYALRRRIGEGQPVCWYRDKKLFYYMRDTGVTASEYPLTSDVFTWCFIDSSDAEVLEPIVIDPVRKLFPIYVTSPKRKRWEKLEQRRPEELVIMNPWTRGELEKAGSILYSNYSQTEMLTRFENAGPSARVCLRYSAKRIKRYYQDREAVIKLDTKEELVHTLLYGPVESVRSDHMSHKLCVVRRSDSEDLSYTVDPISPYVRHRLLAQIWAWGEQERIKLMKQFQRVPGGIHGLLFESHYQHKFAKGIEIEAWPMFRTSDDRSRWHAGIGDFPNSANKRQAYSEYLKNEPRPLNISIIPIGIRPYGTDDNRLEGPIEENVYYVPLAANAVAIDSFIVIKGRMFMFQFASGTSHDLNPYHR